MHHRNRLVIKTLFEVCKHKLNKPTNMDCGSKKIRDFKKWPLFRFKEFCIIVSYSQFPNQTVLEIVLVITFNVNVD